MPNTFCFFAYSIYVLRYVLWMCSSFVAQVCTAIYARRSHVKSQRISSNLWMMPWKHRNIRRSGKLHQIPR